MITSMKFIEIVAVTMAIIKILIISIATKLIRDLILAFLVILV